MNPGKLLTLMSVCGLSVGAYANVYAANAANEQQYDQKTLAQVEALYGLSENAAVTRLGKEYDAAVQARYIEEHHLPSFAGVWFDSATQRLHVAASSKADFNAIERIGATPVLVDRSLTELETARKDIANALTSAVGQENLLESYVDVQANAVVFGITESAMKSASASIATRADVSLPVQLISMAVKPGFSTDLRGADGTKNSSWVVQYGGVHPCSVGASAEKVSGLTYVPGFATAGHCDEVGSVIQSSAGTKLGTVAQSTYSIVNGIGRFSNNEDGSWVPTDPGWVPTPQVNGYTSGTLNVSGTWAGTLDAPVGTTVCRYGSTSGGPHCAPVSVRNETVTVGGYVFYGMIHVNAICTDDGDSGGPLITPANQVQGTVTGGTVNSCPDSSGDVVYFQPIDTTLTTAGASLFHPVAMLTSHGRSAPTALPFNCPDVAESGAHTYQCDIPSYDSQGATTLSWTTNTGSSSSTTFVSGTCSTGQTVNVTLAATNPYGTTTKNGSFLCPINPIP